MTSQNPSQNTFREIYVFILYNYVYIFIITYIYEATQESLHPKRKINKVNYVTPILDN